MIINVPGAKYCAEWAFKANWWIPLRSWTYWRRQGMSPKAINKKFNKMAVDGAPE